MIISEMGHLYKRLELNSGNLYFSPNFFCKFPLKLFSFFPTTRTGLPVQKRRAEQREPFFFQQCFKFCINFPPNNFQCFPQPELGYLYKRGELNSGNLSFFNNVLNFVSTFPQIIFNLSHNQSWATCTKKAS